MQPLHPDDPRAFEQSVELARELGLSEVREGDLVLTERGRLIFALMISHAVALGVVSA